MLRDTKVFRLALDVDEETGDLLITVGTKTFDSAKGLWSHLSSYGLQIKQDRLDRARPRRVWKKETIAGFLLRKEKETTISPSFIDDLIRRKLNEQ